MTAITREARRHFGARGWWLLAAFVVSGALWSALFLGGCFALLMLARVLRGVV